MSGFLSWNAEPVDADLVMSLCRIPAGHTAAPTLAVAEKMADLIKADHAKV